MTEWNSDMSAAPWQTVLEVKNARMEMPLLATRGFADHMGVHPDTSLFTSVAAPDPEAPSSIHFAGGNLICPTHWRYTQGHQP